MDGLSPYELERLERIRNNQQRLAELGVLLAKVVIPEVGKAAVPPRKAAKKQKPTAEPKPSSPPLRSSRRLQGSAPEHQRLVLDTDLHEDLLDDLLERGGGKRKMAQWSDNAAQQALQGRCNSQGRGSIYDSVAGITCHFCRQKKLCGEPDCPRCQSRNVALACIGKSECTRCKSAFGRFCRACLHIRYGLELEDVRKMMEEDSWLCPHCYEEEHPDDGWICNTSICMKNRGLRPTGIAIYEAQERGFKSVAHYLQAQILKRASPTILPTCTLCPPTPSVATPATPQPAGADTIHPLPDQAPPGGSLQACTTPCPIKPAGLKASLGTSPAGAPSPAGNMVDPSSPFARHGDLPGRMTRAAAAAAQRTAAAITDHWLSPGSSSADTAPDSPGTPDLPTAADNPGPSSSTFAPAGTRRRSKRGRQTDTPQSSQENLDSPGSSVLGVPSSSWLEELQGREVLGECRQQQHNIEGAQDATLLLTCASARSQSQGARTPSPMGMPSSRRLRASGRVRLTAAASGQTAATTLSARATAAVEVADLTAAVRQECDDVSQREGPEVARGRQRIVEGMVSGTRVTEPMEQGVGEAEATSPMRTRSRRASRVQEGSRVTLRSSKRLKRL